MKPIPQRIIDQHRGDCMTACLASLLELPYESVPPFVANAYDAGDKTGARDAADAWLRDRNLHLLRVAWDDLNDWSALREALCIASMPSQRFPGGSHAVVAGWDRVPLDGGSHYHQLVIRYDPNPLNEPYDLKKTDPVALSFLVPIDPRGLGTRRVNLFDPASYQESPTDAPFRCSECDLVFYASQARIIDGKREFPCCKKLKELM